MKKNTKSKKISLIIKMWFKTYYNDRNVKNTKTKKHKKEKKQKNYICEKTQNLKHKKKKKLRFISHMGRRRRRVRK